jgi:hypothetical protein
LFFETLQGASMSIFSGWVTSPETRLQRDIEQAHYLIGKGGVRAANTFYKAHLSRFKEDPRVVNIAQQIFAAKLPVKNILGESIAITPLTFKANPGLYEFLSGNHTHNLFKVFPGMQITGDGTVQLLAEKKWHNWSDIKRECEGGRYILTPSYDERRKTRDSSTAYYTHQGITPIAPLPKANAESSQKLIVFIEGLPGPIPEDLNLETASRQQLMDYALKFGVDASSAPWPEEFHLERATLDELLPYLVEFDDLTVKEHPYTGEFTVSIRLEAGEHPSLSEEHPSLKLKSDEEKVYSEGYYRDKKKPSMRQSRGHLHLVEPGEFYLGKKDTPGRLRETALTATRDQFTELARDILIERRDNVILYHLMKINCLAIIWRKLKKHGILKKNGLENLNPKIHGAYYIAHRIVEIALKMPFCRMISNYVLDFHKITHTVTSFLTQNYIMKRITGIAINIFVRLLSHSHCVDEQLKQDRLALRLPPPIPHFRSWTEVFNYKKAYLYSPWKLRQMQNNELADRTQTIIMP